MCIIFIAFCVSKYKFILKLQCKYTKVYIYTHTHTKVGNTFRILHYKKVKIKK